MWDVAHFHYLSHVGYCPLTNGLLPIFLPTMITLESIIDAIERHCAATGMAETTFGKKAVNDGKLLSRLRGGKSINIDTYNRILAVIEAETSEAAQ